MRAPSSLAWQLGPLALLLGLGGCEFKLQLPAGLTIRCDASDPCPSGYLCRAAIATCVDVSLLQDPPAGVTGLALQPTLGNAQTTFALDFQVTGELARPPNAYASAVHLQGAVATYPFACNACSPTVPCHCAFTPDPHDLPPEGTLQVQVEIVDALGNTPPPFSAPSLQLDYTPPSVIPPVSLTLSPAPNVTTPVLELGPGVAAELCFQVDEALGPVPAVWMGPASGVDAGALPFDLVSGYPIERSYCFAMTLGGERPFPDGLLQAWAFLTDGAGNQAQVQLPLPEVDGGASLTVDFTPPPLPDVSQASGLHYLRAPWGQQPNIGQPSYALTSTGSPIAKAGTLVAYADEAQQLELASWPVAPGPLPQLRMLTSDQPEVWVELVDRAGNSQVGGPVEVKSVDWVASLGLKVAGDLQSNPHDCYAKTVFGPTLVSPDDPNTELSAPIGAVTGNESLTVASGGASWRLRQEGVPDLSSNTTSYNPAQGLVMMMDGDDDTVFFNGHDWLYPPESLVPSFRSEYALAYDRTRGKVVLFGGYDDTTTGNPLCDTWELSTSGWQLAQGCTLEADAGVDPAIPPPRAYPCLAYDPDQRQTVLISGVLPSGSNAQDTWGWNGQEWTPLPLSDAGGEFSCTYNAATYFDTRDAGSGLLVLGLPDPSGSAGSPTWLGRWNGQSYQWSQVVPPMAATLAAQALTVDPLTGQAVAVVVDSSTSSPAVELWAWSGVPGSSWSELGTVPTQWESGIQYLLVPFPTPLGSASSLSVLVSGGGYSDQTYQCSLQPMSCTLLHITSYLFPYMVANGLAFDAAGNGVLASSAPGIDDGDLAPWTWTTSEDWELGSAGPSGRQGAPLGYLPSTDRFLLMGGFISDDGGLLDDAWSYTIAGGWQELSAHAPNATPRSYDNLVLIPDAGLPEGLVLAGSGAPPLLLSSLADGGLATTQLAASAPLGGFAYDPSRHRAVIAGQTGAVMYEATPPSFDFTPVHQGVDVPFYAGVIDDGSGGGVLVVGGGATYGSTVEGTLRRWDGQTMQPIPLTDAEDDGDPITDFLPVMALDPSGQRVLVVASNPVQSAEGTWELNLAQSRPAVVCQFRFAAAETPPGTTFSQLQVKGTAGSLGADGGAGSVLSLWSAGTWTPVETCTPPSCSFESPGSLEYTSTDPVAVARLFRDLDTLGVAVSPSVTNGPRLSEIAAGNIQAEISYRLP